MELTLWEWVFLWVRMRRETEREREGWGDEGGKDFNLWDARLYAAMSRKDSTEVMMLA